MEAKEDFYRQTKVVWDDIWAKAREDKEFRWWLQRETTGCRGRKVLFYIEKHLGRIDTLRTVEVGSGAGVYSLILARHGARVTLLDYSRKALSLAKRHFYSFGLPASYLCIDVLRLDSDLMNRFDVAMSFGTVEHYRYPEYFLIARAHISLVREGGVVIIGVPNRLFFPHQILKFCLQRRGKWHLGYERPFLPTELLRLGNRLGLKNIEVYGSALITDMIRYFFIIQNTHLFQRIFRFRMKPVFIRDFPSPLDNLLGADLVLIGQK
jgi:SAM-dependent methyltransferase